MQTFALDAFWARYGREEYADTDFAKALARLPEVSAQGPWLAGGSIRRLISRQPQDSDFDFFFRDQEQFDAFCERMKSLGAKRTSESDFNVTFRLPAAEPKPVEDNVFEGGGPELKVQAIRIQFYATLEASVESFDFSICQFGFDGERLVLGDWSLFDLASKRLVPGKLSYGTASLRRVIKYTRQGFTICGGGLADILEQVVENPAIIQREVEYVD
jgi:hypothetical protein